MSEERYIYVVLVKAHTFLGKMARLIKRYEYTHVAVCLKKPFTDFVTFSRRAHYNPFDCGFMHETLDCYAYGTHDRVKLKVFRVPVSAEEYAEICARVQEIEKDPNLLFDIFSMMTMSIFHGLSIPKAYNCMSFTGEILSMASAVQMNRPSNSYDIQQMDALLEPFFYKECVVKRRKIHYPNYMEHVPLHKVVLDGATLIIHLIGRVAGV